MREIAFEMLAIYLQWTIQRKHAAEGLLRG